MQLSIIIVSYNTREFLRDCLQSVIDKTPKSVQYEIIVVDNQSPDASAEMVRKEFPNVQLIANDENHGFAKACNQGVKRAKGKYLLFLNPDTEVKEDTLSPMIAFMDEHENAGAATCFIKMPDGRLDDGAHRGFPTPWNAFCYFSGLTRLFPKSRFFAGYTMGWLDLTIAHEVDAIVGAFIIVRREAGESIGWWDEDYFFYGEDIDFCYELKEKGWKVYFVPEVYVLHHKGVSGGIKKHSKEIATADRETRIRATNARFDAMKIFYKKHYMRKYPRIITWVVLQGIEFKRRKNLQVLS